VQPTVNKWQDRGSGSGRAPVVFAHKKMVAESQIAPRSERVRVETESVGGSRRVKIRVEGFDEKLGWYSSGSITLAMDQLALVEQAIAEMRSIERARTQDHECEIIPFPREESMLSSKPVVSF
jgi:hypothetical protein